MQAILKQRDCEFVRHKINQNLVLFPEQNYFSASDPNGVRTAAVVVPVFYGRSYSLCYSVTHNYVYMSKKFWNRYIFKAWPIHVLSR